MVIPIPPKIIELPPRLPPAPVPACNRFEKSRFVTSHSLTPGTCYIIYFFFQIRTMASTDIDDIEDHGDHPELGES